MLGLAGVGVTLATAVTPQIAALEQVQHQTEAGPFVEAYRTGEVVAIVDVEHEADRWPQYCAVARRLGVSAVAGVPMRLQDETVGAVHRVPHQRLHASHARSHHASIGAVADAIVNLGLQI